MTRADSMTHLPDLYDIGRGGEVRGRVMRFGSEAPPRTELMSRGGTPPLQSYTFSTKYKME
jgi:hypothetical protein